MIHIINKTTAVPSSESFFRNLVIDFNCQILNLVTYSPEPFGEYGKRILVSRIELIRFYEQLSMQNHKVVDPNVFCDWPTDTVDSDALVLCFWIMEEMEQREIPYIPPFMASRATLFPGKVLGHFSQVNRESRPLTPMPSLRTIQSEV